ncbi:leucyl aminopeptidase family protein [Parasulfuritortus cantonensis]|uniref:Leucyl aminopeptidase family protein n=1 Tax=Parasulfuritortus cantonensis TaxID=2528202 RepID=A0A4R1B7E1_9PROT|nr:leucyl aminopeptidase family protein [Parasulfuritortus cantonensis]TCJ11509.1 leucyl aminopeptidase family protein [Parasulfuritortus cantonensis]
MRLAGLDTVSAQGAEAAASTGHLLVVLTAGAPLPDIPGRAALEAVLKRRGKKADSLAKAPLAVTLPDGGLSVWLSLADAKPAFDWHEQLRKALKPLLEENPAELAVAVHGDDGFRDRAARAAVYAAWVNGAQLSSWKSDKPGRALKRVVLYGAAGLDLARERAIAEGNLLCRELTRLPPNLLDPGQYRKCVRALAKEAGWAIEEFDVASLTKLKAGAFLAVARGSGHQDAAVVRLSYRGAAKAKALALVGKGICFDTGGHNLKPARYMHNMHDDMNGSAVVLGILLAATRLKLPVNLEVWLAIAQNHLSPEAYTQNEVVTALNGTTIEVVHTDAEGRMVLADALAMAAREKPGVMIDFATLTGSMVMALGERMSGVLGNRDDLVQKAVAAGQATGERVVAFAMPTDYDEALDSEVADVKQCTLDGEADHILAARFLSRFVADVPWLHVDLSAARCKGGLGAVAGDVTGFGVALGLALLDGLAAG